MTIFNHFGNESEIRGAKIKSLLLKKIYFNVYLIIDFVTFFYLIGRSLILLLLN